MRSKMHDFGGSGFPHGNLVAVFHTERPNDQRAAR
jgi:hypothetical protein